MLPFEVIEIAAAAVSCAAPGGLSLGSGGWTSSCATHARLVEVQDSESPPAGVDRTKCDEFASKGTTPGRGQSFSDGIETITRSSSSIVRKSLLSLERKLKNLVNTYSKILFRFNFLRLPYGGYLPFYLPITGAPTTSISSSSPWPGCSPILPPPEISSE